MEKLSESLIYSSLVVNESQICLGVTLPTCAFCGRPDTPKHLNWFFKKPMWPQILPSLLQLHFLISYFPFHMEVSHLGDKWPWIVNLNAVAHLS